MAGKKWIDVTVPMREGMVHWPGDPAFRRRKIKDIAKGDSSTVSLVAMGVHTGTHVDAPRHFIRRAKGIDSISIGRLVGPARVIVIRNKKVITEKELRSHRIRKGQRVVFKTRNSSRAWGNGRFVKDFVYLSHESARYLVKLGISTVGIDYLSVGGYKKDGALVHRTLLRGGVAVIEGLDLGAVRQGWYDLVCLPLKITGSDGAPARAIMRKR